MQRKTGGNDYLSYLERQQPPAPTGKRMLVKKPEPKAVACVLSVRGVGSRWVFEKPSKPAPPIVYRVPPELLSEFLASGQTAQDFLASAGLLPELEPEPQMPTVRAVARVTAIDRDKTERLSCEWMAENLGGMLEFGVPAGRIDVLTESTVFEVKQAHNWKHALGQVLVYGSYFPDREKVIVLVGKTQQHIEIAKSHCAAFNVQVVDFAEL
jgi:hypothetical protein